MAVEGGPNGGQSDIVTLTDAAARLGKSERTIRRMIASGKLPTVTIGGRTCVQLGGADTPPASDNTPVTATANTVTDGGTLSELRDRLEDSLRDRIRHLEAENERLWSLVHAALPAPKHSERRPREWLWILLAVTLAAAIGVGAWWLGAQW